MKYDDIIDLPRPRSVRPPMASADRAAQFSAFAALTGYDEAIDETARPVIGRTELSEEEKEELDEKLRLILEAPGCEAALTYFVPDPRKDGGCYVTKRGVIRNIDEAAREIIFEDRTAVSAKDVLDIDADILSGRF